MPSCIERSTHGNRNNTLKALHEGNDYRVSVPIISLAVSALKGDCELCLEAGMHDCWQSPCVFIFSETLLSNGGWPRDPE